MYRREVSKIEDTSLKCGTFSFRSSSCVPVSVRLAEFKVQVVFRVTDGRP